MATAALLPPARFTVFDANGDLVPGALIHTYVPGGTVSKATWQDLAETIPNANPIVCDSAGSCRLYGSGTYQLTITDADGVAVPGYSGLSQSPGFISDAMLPVVGALSLSAAMTALGISAAMQPVVAGATLAAAMTALGISAAMQPAVGAATTGAALAVLDAQAIVATIAALRLASAAMPDAVYVACYSTPADDGGGVFVYVPTDITTLDNGGTIIVDALSRRWYRDRQGQLPSVKWFGAKGDGVTDDSAAFNNALATNGGLVGGISIPAGKYVLGAGLTYTMANSTAEFRIQGAGSEVTQLIWTVAAGLTVNFIGQFNSISISGMSMLTHSNNAATAISLVQTAVVPNAGNTPVSSITDVTLRGFDGYSVTNCWAVGIQVSISNINFSGLHIVGSSADDGIGVYIQGPVGSPPVVFDFVSCYFETLSQCLIYGGNVQGIAVTGCNFIGKYGITNTAGLGLGDQLAVTNSQFACSLGGIVLQSQVSNVAISNSLFIIASNVFGIYLASSNVFQIVGNSFVPDVASVNQSGIGILATGLPGLITGNAFQSLAVGISLGAATANNNVQSNLYTSVATHTVNLGAGNVIGGGSA